MTDLTAPRKRIAVLGGGIAGLTATYTLARARQAGAPIEELLIEGRNRLGGVIRTENVDGFVMEAGPDSFLAEKPEAAELARELGLGDELIGSNDSQRRTYILHCGKLVPLPDGLLLLVPTRIWPMVTTRLLPLGAKLAMAREWFTPPPAAGSGRVEDESVASFVERHFGREMLENIADPLLAGVYGGSSKDLSLRSVLPRFWEMERKYGSLTRATLRARREHLKAARDSRLPFPVALPLFVTLKGGLEQLLQKLGERVEKSRVRLGQRAVAVEAAPAGGRYRILCEGGVNHDAQAVIFAMPTRDAARLLSGIDASLAQLLDGIPYSSSMTVSLGYGEGSAAKLPRGFGFLVARKEKRRMLACTFVHAKFKHRAPEGRALLRCFLGGTRDPEVLSLDDQEILEIVKRELAEILRFSAQPVFHRIHRWPHSMAQYVVGHAERVGKIQAQLEKHPGLFLAGNAFSGIGISDCVRTGRAAAEQALRACIV